MATALATAFYLDIGYSRSEIGLIAKNAGLWCSVVGGLAGGFWLMRFGVHRSLWHFGIVQAVTILGFFWLFLNTNSNWSDFERQTALALVVGAEALGVGLGTTALVAFITQQTNPLYTATQFALFTSLAAIPRTFMNALTGWMVDAVGWGSFFVICFCLALPGMLLLLKIKPIQLLNSDSGKNQT